VLGGRRSKPTCVERVALGYGLRQNARKRTVARRAPSDAAGLAPRHLRTSRLRDGPRSRGNGVTTSERVSERRDRGLRGKCGGTKRFPNRRIARRRPQNNLPVALRLRHAGTFTYPIRRGFLHPSQYSHLERSLANHVSSVRAAERAEFGLVAQTTLTPNWLPLSQQAAITLRFARNLRLICNRSYQPQSPGWPASAGTSRSFWASAAAPVERIYLLAVRCVRKNQRAIGCKPEPVNITHQSNLL
jgi:hypothetical protein